MHDKPLTLQIVLKFVERCNINCTYCYVFNGENDDWKYHPPYMKSDVVNEVIQFLKQGCEELNIVHIAIIFHDGEPLMYKKKEFDKLCDNFKSELSSCRLSFSLQTNAMLVNDEWISLFHKHNVGIGVSLDGPKEHNDINRVDHKGRGTYDRVVAGLRRLQDTAEKKLLTIQEYLRLLIQKLMQEKFIVTLSMNLV